MRPGRAFLTTAIVLLALCATLPACRTPESGAGVPTPESQPGHPVAVIEVEPVSLTDVLVLPGQTQAWQDVQISSETGGTVEWIGPVEGDRVTRGALLMKIDVSSLKAALEKAEAAYSLADSLYQRRKRLSERGIINQEALDHSVTDRTLAKGNLEQARVEYEKGFVRTPVDGVVNHVDVDVGEFVNRGEPLFDVVNVDRIEVNVNAPEMDVRFFRPGQDALVTVDALPDSRMRGTVDFVSYKADPVTKTFAVKVVIDNPEHVVRPGMIARVALVRRVVEEALVAPLFAVVEKGGEKILFVEEDGVARARTAVLGVIDGDRVQVVEGLEKGEHLVVKGQTDLEEGMKVLIP